MTPDHLGNVRLMTGKELTLAIDWAAAEGWNPGIADAEPFFAADPKGFFLAELADQMVGSISAVAYGASFGFMGLYIVRPEYRGQGLGRRLFQAGMDYRHIHPRIARNHCCGT